MFDERTPFAPQKRCNRHLSLSEYRSGQTQLRSLPRALFVELTQGCNLKCPMCRSAIIPPATRRMTAELFQRIAQELFPTAELVDLRGWGESLILPEALDRIEITRQYGAKIRLVTNLSFRRDSVLNALVAADAMIDVSLDTCEPALLKKVRGGANLGLISRNTSYLVDRFGHGRNLAFLVTVQQATISTLPALIEHAARLGVLEVRLFSVTVEGGSTLTIDNSTVAVDTALQNVSAVAKARGVRVVAGSRMGSLPPNPVNIEPCIHPWAYCYIAFNGEVSFCDHLIGPGNAGYLVGDLRKSDFAAIWNGDAMQRIRREHLGERRAEAPQFAHCSWCYKNKYIDFEHLFVSGPCTLPVCV